MRTLSANLTTAQKADTGTPYIELNLRSRDGATTLSFKTTDSPNKIVSIKQAEGRTNGHISISGSGREISTLIRLRDADGAIGGTSRTGYRVSIGWGFNTAGGDESSFGPPAFVFRQRRLTGEGESYTEFVCISSWDLLSNTFLSVDTAGLQKFSGDIKTRRILMIAAGGVSPSAVIRDDGGVSTDFTTEAADLTTEDDVGFFSASPQIDDAVYFGAANQFNRVSIDLTTPGTGQIVAWEYSTGAGTWAALADVVDNTTSFTSGILKIVSFTHPGAAWVTDTVNSQGPFFYVRARVTTAGSGAATTGAAATVGLDLAVQLDEATGSFNEDYKPNITVDWRLDSRTLIEHLLSYTQLGIVAKSDGFHIVHIDPAEAVSVYNYDSTHPPFENNTEFGEILPNRFTFLKLEPDFTVGTQFTGTATQASSVTAWGNIDQLLVNDSILSNAEAVQLASNLRDRLVIDSAQGFFMAPMNCGQEVWDYITVTNPWLSDTFNGHITHVLRNFESGIYDIELTLGGYEAITESNIGGQLRPEDLRTEISPVQERRLQERAIGERVIARTLQEFAQAEEDAMTLRALRMAERTERARRIQRAVHAPLEIPRTPSGRPAQPAFREDIIVPERLPTPPPAQAGRFRRQGLPMLEPGERTPSAVPRPTREPSRVTQLPPMPIEVGITTRPEVPAEEAVRFRLRIRGQSKDRVGSRGTIFE